MEEEGSVNFKALRAKFQEEALMAASRASRPAVAGKPKHIPPPGSHCSSTVLNSINIAVENQAVPRVFFKDGLRTSGGKKPISLPPQPQRSPTSHNGNGPTRQSLKDRHMPLVLPIFPKEHKAEQASAQELKLEVQQLKEGVLQTKTKKKGLLLPFKSAKLTKASSENGEEPPSYPDLTSRPSSAPGELLCMKKHNTDDRTSLQGSECSLSSPDTAITPPSAEMNVDSENKVISTLEKAKKKFSRRQVWSSTKPKSSSPDRGFKGEAQGSPPNNTQSTAPDPPVFPPVCFTNLAYISARPFFKGTSTFKSPFDKHFGKDRTDRPFARTGGPYPPSPPTKPLPDLRVLGPLPAKPPRPPVVDLGYYIFHTVQDGSRGLNHAPAQEPHPSVIPVLDAPEFPDFEISEIEPVERKAVDIATLDLAALDLYTSDLPVPDAIGPLDFEEPQPDWSVCDHTKSSEVNLGNPNIIPLNPDHFPGPINLSEFPELTSIEQWSQSKEATIDPSSHTDETDHGGAECYSIPEDIEQGEHSNNFDYGVYQRGFYQTTCDNVYEDVETISKFMFNQNSRKRKGLKNPYADSNSVREESEHNTWLRNACKECQSPNTADCKEQKKREKQRLEKEKKEQKEREKKENEMKKKFKVTGEEEPMYHAKVMVASKVRKNDLPVKSGDIVGIIRTTNCPKGKWLARDANHKYGYISVMNVELNMKEMLELGKKAQAAGRGGNVEADTISIGSRSSSHPVLTSSFTDDSEEWACEDETLSPSNESLSFSQQAASLPEMSCGHVGAQHTLSDANLEDLHSQTKHEALQKLAVFFQHNKNKLDGNGVSSDMNTETPNLCDVEEPPYLEQEVDFTEMELLPPPPLYADFF